MSAQFLGLYAQQSLSLDFFPEDVEQPGFPGLGVGSISFYYDTVMYLRLINGRHNDDNDPRG